MELETPTTTTTVLGDWLQSLQTAEAQTLGGLTIVAVRAAAVANNGLEYLTLAQALDAGQVLITEQTQASVPTLQVINTGDLPLLLLDGEEVVGGRQNRVVNTTVLVPAHSTFDLDVTCVEHGRWFQAAAAFAPGEAVYPSLRAQKAHQVSAALEVTAGAHADQSLVWREIASRQRRSQTVAPTDAMHDMYAQRNDALEQAERRFSLPEGAVGLIAVIAGRARCADVFDKPATLMAYWSRLVRSYALEADGTEDGGGSGLESAKRLLSRAGQANQREFASRGLGTDVRLSGRGVIGAGLVYQGLVIHTAIFRQPTSKDSAPMSRPSQRARRFDQEPPTNN